MIKATNNNFDELIKSDKLVLVDFFATWCGPCKMLGQTIGELENPHQNDTVFVSVDIDKNPELLERFSIRSIPTMIFFKNGKQIHRSSGAVSEAVLESTIQGFLK